MSNRLQARIPLYLCAALTLATLVGVGLAVRENDLMRANIHAGRGGGPSPRFAVIAQYTAILSAAGVALGWLSWFLHRRCGEPRLERWSLGLVMAILAIWVLAMTWATRPMI